MSKKNILVRVVKSIDNAMWRGYDSETVSGFVAAVTIISICYIVAVCTFIVAFAAILYGIMWSAANIGWWTLLIVPFLLGLNLYQFIKVTK